MTTKLDELIRLLDLEQVEENLFRAFHPQGESGEPGGRLFGGQIMAQALMAAARTVPAERRAHSLHGYFLRQGNPAIAAVIKVERLRDGGTFSNRRVLVVQDGEPIFNMDASFQRPESGRRHQMDNPRPDLSPPQADNIPDYLYASAFISWHHEFRRLQQQSPQPPEQFVWFKANGAVPDDPLLNACLLVYESDNTLMGTSRLPHRGSFQREQMQAASLDHAMWFHHPADVSDWLLYALDSPSTSAGRGLSRGSIYDLSGRLVASTVQESLIRLH